MANRSSDIPIRGLPIAVLAVALAACQPQPAPPAADAPADDAASASIPGEGLAPGERLNFQCGELALGVTFDEGGERARLSFSGRQLELPIAVSASGARYADDDGNEFWSKGLEDASLTLAGEERRECSPSDRISPWDQAAERGVSFRAIGQEPGWLVEVQDGDEGASLTAHLDYGQRLLEVAELSSEDANRYQGQAADGTSVVLTIEERDCADPMSGERFRAAASLAVGDQQYEGCGARLSN